MRGLDLVERDSLGHVVVAGQVGAEALVGEVQVHVAVQVVVGRSDTHPQASVQHHASVVLDQGGAAVHVHSGRLGGEARDAVDGPVPVDINPGGREGDDLQEVRVVGPADRLEIPALHEVAGAVVQQQRVDRRGGLLGENPGVQPVRVHPVADDQVQPAVVVQVRHVHGHRASLRHRGDGALDEDPALVLVDHDAPVGDGVPLVEAAQGALDGHDQVGVAVVVQVGGAGTTVLGQRVQAHLSRHVLEAAIPQVAVQGVGLVQAVGEVDVEPAVVIDVQQGHAGPYGPPVLEGRVQLGHDEAGLGLRADHLDRCTGQEREHRWGREYP